MYNKLIGTLLFLICTSIGAISQETCKWLEDIAEWSYTPWGLTPAETTVQVNLIGDTLIDNRICSVLGFFDNDGFVAGSELIVFYDRVSAQVDYYEGEEFRKMYDFSPNVQTGDTLTFMLPQAVEFYDISSSGGDFLPSPKSYLLRIVNQEVITTPDGQAVRISETEPVLNEFEECFDMGRIIDGVGSSFGLLGRSCNQLTSGFPEFFRCFTSSTLQYVEVDGDCVITSTGDPIDNVPVSVFPNPSFDQINIETQTAFNTMVLYDLKGRVILNQVYENSLNVSHLTEGTYILELSSNDSIYRTKILKLR